MISIIIVSWKVRDLLSECLKTLTSIENDFDYEIIVVDNNSQDQTAEMIAQDFPRVEFIGQAKNLGYAKACNLGAQKATGNFLLFLNPDTRWHQKVLSRLKNFTEDKDKVGAVGIKILNPDKSIQPSVRKLPTAISLVALQSKFHLLNKKILDDYLNKNFDYQKTQPVEQVSGAFLFIKKEVFNNMNGFDQIFFTWFEEVDLCRRLLNSGYQNYYFSEVSIIHHGEQSFQQAGSLKKQLIFNRSLKHYIKKHHSSWLYFLILLINPINLFSATLITIFRIKPKHYL